MSPTRLLPLALLLFLFGCKAAPDPVVSVSEGNILDASGSAYANFLKHEELLLPSLEPWLAEAEAYMAGENNTSCYQATPLQPLDVGDTIMLGRDPSGVVSAVHAEVLRGTPRELEAVLFVEDWAEVFEDFTEWQLEGEENREAYLAGTSELYGMTYTGTLAVVGARLNLFVVLQFRAIADWQGTGHPLIMIRTFQPEAATTNNPEVTLDSAYSLELLIPSEDGTSTLRIFANWTELSIYGAGADNAFGVACNQLVGTFEQVQEWRDENYPER